MSKQTRIEKIYCTKNALAVLENYEYDGEYIKPKTIAFLAANPQLMAVHKCPFQILIVKKNILVHTPNESVPLKANLLAQLENDRWHYTSHKPHLVVERNNAKKPKRTHHDHIAVRFF